MLFLKLWQSHQPWELGILALVFNLCPWRPRWEHCLEFDASLGYRVIPCHKNTKTSKPSQKILWTLRVTNGAYVCLLKLLMLCSSVFCAAWVASLYPALFIALDIVWSWHLIILNKWALPGGLIYINGTHLEFQHLRDRKGGLWVQEHLWLHRERDLLQEHIN